MCTCESLTYAGAGEMGHVYSSVVRVLGSARRSDRSSTMSDSGKTCPSGGLYRQSMEGRNITQ